MSITDTSQVGSKVHWYAARVRSRHEKRVAEHLAGKGIEFFLPLYAARHRWSDRMATVQLPLFPGYLFAQFDLRDRLMVLEVPGVVQLVSTGGTPVPLDDTEIQILRQGLNQKIKAEPHPYLSVGTRVRVKRGPLAGLEGIIHRSKSIFRVIVSVDLIMRSIALEIPASDVDPL